LRGRTQVRSNQEARPPTRHELCPGDEPCETGALPEANLQRRDYKRNGITDLFAAVRSSGHRRLRDDAPALSSGPLSRERPYLSSATARRPRAKTAPVETAQVERQRQRGNALSSLGLMATNPSDLQPV
jgi:hypothetical protein